VTSLPEADQWRLGVPEDGKNGPHRLTYRQTEYSFALVAAAQQAAVHDAKTAEAARCKLGRLTAGGERGDCRVQCPAANDTARGWCRLAGLAPVMLFTTVLLAAAKTRARRRATVTSPAQAPPPRSPAPGQREHARTHQTPPGTAKDL
jgi:hypothetical protein